MSQLAREWVLSIEDKELNGTRRLVLYLLAEHHNGETGACFPGRELLAKEAGTTPRAVTRALNWLKNAGYVESDRRHRENGSRSSNGYAFPGLGDAGVTLDCSDTDLSDVRGQSKVTFEVIQGDAGVTPITGREPEGEREETTTSSPDVLGRASATPAPAAVEVRNSQGTDHEQDLLSLVAKLETSKARDKSELNGSHEEGGARTAQELPAELASISRSLSAGEAVNTRRVWEQSGRSMPVVREYRCLRTGKGHLRVYRHSEAVAKLFPEAVSA